MSEDMSEGQRQIKKLGDDLQKIREDEVDALTESYKKLITRAIWIASIVGVMAGHILTMWWV